VSSTVIRVSASPARADPCRPVPTRADPCRPVPVKIAPRTTFSKDSLESGGAIVWPYVHERSSLRITMQKIRTPGSLQWARA